MSTDVFCHSNACKLLERKTIWMFGDSNMRGMYKDLVWLLEKGTLLSGNSLKTKNENSHANDRNLSKGALHAGRTYEEVREYTRTNFIRIRFTFITKLFSENFVECFEKARELPDCVVLNSCLWDLSRWGPDGVRTFKENLSATLCYLRSKLPTTTRVIFLTTLPVSFQCVGGFLRKEVEFMRSMLPWHIIEANAYMADQVQSYKYDIVDLHHRMKFLIEEWGHDGIHWTPTAYRFMTNTLLTHIALCDKKDLPNIISVDKGVIGRAEVVVSPPGAQNVRTEAVQRDGQQYQSCIEGQMFIGSQNTQQMWNGFSYFV